MALKIGISALKGDPGARQNVEYREAVGLPGEAAPTGPANVQVQLVNTGDVITLSGTAVVPVRLRCARCLEEFETSLEAQLEDQYREVARPPGEAESRRALEEEGVILYHGEEIDLDPPVRESLALAVPMQPLCGEDCRGICPACGLDLNRGTCRCEPEAGDSRLEALRRFRPKETRPDGPKER